MQKLKKILYVVSIVPVVADVIIGAIKGIVKGVNDVKLKAQQEWDLEQAELFRSSFKNPVLATKEENIKK